MLSRRDFLALTALATACATEPISTDVARLTSRPRAPEKASRTRGFQRLRLSPTERDATLYVPEGVKEPAPLLVLLHGATGRGERIAKWLSEPAHDAGLIVLAPDSRDITWDLVRGGFGPDVVFIDRALQEVFARHAIDANRLAIGGFSDGASYALSLGIGNGDLFRHIIAFSPGFMQPAGRRGAPRFFISHGVDDEILPIERCGRFLARRLERERYDVTYREFEGPHTVPPEIAAEAFGWLANFSAGTP